MKINNTFCITSAHTKETTNFETRPCMARNIVLIGGKKRCPAKLTYHSNATLLISATKVWVYKNPFSSYNRGYY